MKSQPKTLKVLKRSLPFLLALMACIVSKSQIITNNSSGFDNSFYYDFLKNYGNVELELKDEGTYKVSWTSDENNDAVFIAGKGYRNTTGKDLVEYAADFENESGNAYLFLHGYFEDIKAEFYIIEDFYGYDLSMNLDPIDTIVSDGSKYIYYKDYMISQGIDPVPNYYRYVIVRQDKRRSGAITIKNHYNKIIEIDNSLEGYGFEFLLFSVETYYANNGYCDVYKLIWNSKDPDVEFTSLQENDKYTIGNEVLISADISPKQGAIEKVEFFVGDEKIGETTEAPYETVWVSDTVGPIPITIVAIDTDGWDAKKTVSIYVKNKPVTHLTKGWNLIGYANGSAPIEDALADIWEYVEIVKNFDSFYMLEMNEELNTLQQLTYGNGYYIKVTEDCSLEWQE